MKKKKVLLCCALTVMSLSLSACNFLPENMLPDFMKNSDKSEPAQESSVDEGPHLHTYDTKTWVSDDTYHWHPSTCGHNNQGEKKAHTFGTPTILVEATCETSGEQKEVCTVCGYEKTTEIPRGHHNWQVYYTKEANCTEQGEVRSQCTYCGENRVSYSDAIGHSYQVISETPATCQNTGKRIEMCTRCGDYKETILEASGHFWIDDGLLPDTAAVPTVPCYKSHCAYDNSVRLTINAFDGWVNGTTRDEGLGFLKLAYNGDTVTYTFNYDNNAYGILYQRGLMNYWNNSNYHHLTYRSSGTSSFYDEGYNFGITFNDEELDLSTYADISYEEFFSNGDDYGFGTSYSRVADCPIATIHLVPGVNTLTYKRNNNYGLSLESFVMIVTNSNHDHIISSSWSRDTDAHWHACEAPNCPVADYKADYGPHEFTERVIREATCSVEGSKRQTCSVCGYTRTVAIPTTSHDVQHAGVVSYQGCTAIEEYTCVNCGQAVYRWDARNYDTALSNDIDTSNSDYIRFMSTQYQNGDMSITGSHIVYKIYLTSSATNVRMSFRASNNTSADSVFEYMTGDSKPGYELNDYGELVQPTHRYGLNVNGQRIPLGEDKYRGTYFGSLDWYEWPVTLSLRAGVNTIDIFALGTYRARMYEFELSGVPYIEPNHVHEMSNEMNFNNDYHWYDCIYNDGYTFNKEPHQYGEYVVVEEATCYASGTRVRTCQICGYQQYSSTGTLSHEYGEATILQEPTCTEYGLQMRICSVCGQERQDEIAPLGHDWDEGYYIQEPTETSSGIIRYTCRRCMETRDETAKAGHTWSEPVTIYGDEGMVNYTKQNCVNDDFVRLDIKSLDGQLAEGSSFKGGSPEGFMKLSGNNYSVSYTFNVDRNYFGVIYMKGAIDSYSSTGSRGYYSTKNSMNDEIGNFELKVNDETVDYSHMRNITYAEMLDGGENILDSTYSPVAECEVGYLALKEGTNTITFTRLSSYNLLVSDFVMVVSPTEHNHTLSASYYSDDNTHWQTCEDPNCYFDSNHRFEEAAHDFGDDNVIVPATCTEDGYGERTCLICGRTVPFTIFAYGHTFDEGVVTVTPTEDTNGEMVYTCVNCGMQKVKTLPSLNNYEWSSENIINGVIDNGKTPTIIDFGDGVQALKFNNNISFSLTYYSETAKTMRLRMLISVKISNIRNTGLWYQNGSEKTHITVNGVAMTPPETDVVYDEYEDLHNPSGASDGSNLSVPVWIDLGEINIVAGENVIEITNMMSSYSYFICGVGLSIV